MTRLPWTQMSREDVSKLLRVDIAVGLSEAEASKRLQENGSNVLLEKKRRSLLLIFLEQFRDFMVLVLLLAALVSGLLQEYGDAITIMVIVLVNACLGFIQEYRAERSLEALRDLTAPAARVLRDKIRRELPAAELVPGDVVLLEAGDRIPADIRLYEVSQLMVNEAPLTGESESVLKNIAQITGEKVSLGDQRNMGFMGTMILSGRGGGLVVATGMNTEMGRIAHLIQEAEQGETPLQKRLGQLGRYLVLGCLSVCTLVVAMGLAQGLPPYKMFMTGVSLAVAAIPEGLPAVVTIALAIGVQRMARKNAIVRRLPAVETLGCATVICSDKTGTLTQNKMNVREIWAGGTTFGAEGEGYSPQGVFWRKNVRVKANTEASLLLALSVAVLCNNAVMRKGAAAIRPLWRGGGKWRNGILTGTPRKVLCW